MSILEMLSVPLMMILAYFIVRRGRFRPAPPIGEVTRDEVRETTRDEVVDRARSEYPAEAELVLSELDSYSGREPDRVKLDILILSAGSLADLKRWVKMANNDYRDVLSAAEYGGTEPGSEILREFHAWKPPGNSEELSFEDLMREDSAGGASGH